MHATRGLHYTTLLTSRTSRPSTSSSTIPFYHGITSEETAVGAGSISFSKTSDMTECDEKRLAESWALGVGTQSQTIQIFFLLIPFNLLTSIILQMIVEKLTGQGAPSPRLAKP